MTSRDICRGVGLSSRKGEHFPFRTKFACTKIKPFLDRLASLAPVEDEGVGGPVLVGGLGPLLGLGPVLPDRASLSLPARHDPTHFLMNFCDLIFDRESQVA